MRQRQPASSQVARVRGLGASTDSHGTAAARSQGSQLVQSS
jgi:hypothetical protein